MTETTQEFSSFRDPSGFIYKKDNEIYRQVNFSYKEDYDLLMNSGLYEKLTSKKWLVEHIEVEPENGAYKTLKPQLIDYISYPYEWSFSMLKDAALLTLKIQKQALKHGMSLKDATAYNIQFTKDASPIFIDTLSFEKFEEKPWNAYAQFCRHFLAPLLLITYTDNRLQNLLRDYIDGIPLDLASKLLPFKTKINPSIMMHIHLHAKKTIQLEGDASVNVKALKMSKNQQLAIIDSLKDLVKSLKWQPQGTEWGEYYTFTNYSDESFNKKKEIVSGFIDKVQPKNLWDLGANNGLFTRLGSEKGIPSIAFDIDPIAVEKNYLQIKTQKEENLLSIISDLTNPTPAIGWANKERMSFIQKGKADVVMVLALIHHLSISNNLPFEKTASFFSEFAKNLIIEFVPKSDSKVKILLSTREDIFPNYTEECFENEYSKYFDIIEKIKIDNTERTLYLMKNKKNI